jgi:hypothetical protein
MRRVSRSVVAAVVVVTLFFGLGIRAAFATPAGDVILADLLANAIQALAQGAEALKTLREQYATLKETVGYAREAIEVGKSFNDFAVKRFGTRFVEDLNDAYPDVAYYRRDVFQRDGLLNSEWGRTYSGIDRLFTYCLADVVGERPACAQLQRQLDSNKALHALGATFGEAPKDPKTVREKQAKVIDAEVAAALLAVESAKTRHRLVELEAQETRRRCERPTTDRDQTECAAAAQRAQIRLLEEQAHTNTALAELARLQALSLEQHNADLKRQLEEASARRVALGDAAAEVGAQKVEIRGGGFIFTDGE